MGYAVTQLTHAISYATEAIARMVAEMNGEHEGQPTELVASEVAGAVRFLEERPLDVVKAVNAVLETHVNRFGCESGFSMMTAGGRSWYRCNKCGQRLDENGDC